MTSIKQIFPDNLQGDIFASLKRSYRTDRNGQIALRRQQQLYSPSKELKLISASANLIYFILFNRQIATTAATSSRPDKTNF